MYYDEHGGTLNFLVGVAVGAVLGAAVALVVAPDPGRRIRKRVRETAGDLGETAGEKLQSAARDVRELAEDARKAAERSGDRLRGGVKPIRKKLRF